MVERNTLHCELQNGLVAETSDEKVLEALDALTTAIVEYALLKNKDPKAVVIMATREIRLQVKNKFAP